MSDSAVNLQNLGTQLGIQLGIGPFAGGLLASAILTGLVLVPILFFTKGKNPMLSFLIGFVMVSLSVAIGWIPIWTFAVIALLTALLFGSKIAERF
jgi:hypothetical protein